MKTCIASTDGAFRAVRVSPHLRPCFGRRLMFLAAAATCTACGASIGAEKTELHIAVASQGKPDGSAEHPFRSPAEALEELRRIASADRDAEVHLVFHPGVYRVTEPIRIGRAEVPRQGRLVLRAASPGTATISGGVVLGHWQVPGDGRWTTHLPEVVRAGAIPRELFAGGSRRPRARHPNKGYLRVGAAFPDKRTGFSFAAGALPSGYRGGGELVFLHDWSTSRIPVRSVDHRTHRLVVAFPIGNRAPHYRIDHFEPHPRFFVEDHAALLDMPGEWYIDPDGRVTYLPLPGETPEGTEVVVPVSPGLLRVSGDESGAVQNVLVRGLRFEHAAWLIPPRGYAGSQATAHEARGDAVPSRRPFVPAALSFERARDCAVEACHVVNVGMSGIELGSRTSRCRVVDSVIADVAGNGINLGEDRSRRVGSKPWWQAAPEQVALGHRVEYNRIERCGQQFFGAVAVWIGLARETTVAHNEIAHHPYTGVSAGWMWSPTPTPAGGNRIMHNHIHHVMRRLSDGGGIYTLGRQPGTRLAFNVIHDVPANAGRAESNGMFIDEGSDQIEIDHNTIYGVARSPLRFHRARGVRVHHNLLVVPGEKVPPYRYNATDPATVDRRDDRVVVAEEFDPARVKLPATGPRP